MDSEHRLPAAGRRFLPELRCPATCGESHSQIDFQKDCGDFLLTTIVIYTHFDQPVIDQSILQLGSQPIGLF